MNVLGTVLEIRTVFRADRGSRIPDLKPCKNTRIRIPDLRIRIPVKIRGSGSRICGSRISNTGSEALFPGRIDPSLSYRHLLNIQCLKPPLLSSIVKLSLCTCLYIFFSCWPLIKSVQCTCQIVNILLCIHIINVKIKIINYTSLL